jgi:hypothetical protein
MVEKTNLRMIKDSDKTEQPNDTIIKTLHPNIRE